MGQRPLAVETRRDRQTREPLTATFGEASSGLWGGASWRVRTRPARRASRRVSGSHSFPLTSDPRVVVPALPPPQDAEEEPQSTCRDDTPTRHHKNMKNT